MASGFGRVGSITAPLIIGALSASVGFAGVFGLTTAVLATGVIVTLVFALSTAERSLEELAAPLPPDPGRSDTNDTEQGALSS
ncbi:hypothetical protein [Actinoallomurus oryzae]|uniref:hypothetical protein n=1 Tax=Actinoallomurus oryzae TaxID=502180 RepID=UPI003CD0A8F7